MKSCNLRDFLSVYSFGIGTWQAGKSHWVGVDDQLIEDALNSAYLRGIRLFDTAPDYGYGHAERVLGRLMRRWNEPVCIISKISPFNLSYLNVIESCEKSLKRLKQDCIDGLLVHWPSGSFNSEKIPIEQKLFFVPFIITQLIRGAGYFNGGFILIILLMLYSLYSKNNNHNKL